jgi:nuclear transport factor 2 (NTF2) superfamily protein
MIAGIGFSPIEMRIGSSTERVSWRGAWRATNDLPICEADRKYLWPLGHRPDEDPGLSELGL